MLRDKRLILAIILMASVAVSFWAGSRVPQLNEKALMGGDTQLDALGFDTVFQAQPTDPVYIKIAYTTVNWMQTNKKGMTFGIVFGAIIMLMLSLIKKKSTQSGFANTLLGMTIGAPLGVCVNCAAPIAKGMHAGGARVETMLAAMVSSPTLNVIVLTMLFSLFPSYMIAIKMALTLGFILIVIPLLSRWLHPIEGVSAEAQALLTGEDPEAACEIPFWDNPPDGWFEASRWVVVEFFKNLFHIVKTTVPLMFLAGLLGAIVITVLPWDTLAGLVPERGPLFSGLAMAVMASIGIFLPVPIAFDVLVPAILIAAGFPVKYAMVLLFTLGIFSIYPFFIVWNSVGKGMATAMCVTLVAIGVGAGFIGDFYFERDNAEQQEIFFSMLGENAKAKGPTFLRFRDDAPPVGDDLLLASLNPGRLGTSPQAGGQPPGIAVERLAFRGDREASEGTFVRRPGTALGLDDSGPLSVVSFASLSRFRPISTGDVHGDGRPDLLTASGGKLMLYANKEGKSFAAQQLPLGALADAYVMNAALVDLDNDGWLDIYISTFREGNHILHNRGGSFVGATPELLPNRERAQATAATAFGDIDRDGDIDIVLGNYTLGSLAGNWTSESARNAWLEQVDGGWVVHNLDALPGESQTALLTDIDGDGAADVMIGNDFNPPDDVYLGDGHGGFKKQFKADGLLPHTAWSTMSLDSADVDNDLSPELYIGQITGFSGGTGIVRRQIEKRNCAAFDDPALIEHCEQVMEMQLKLVTSKRTKNVRLCKQLDERFEEDCIAVLLLASAAQWNRDQSMCDLFPEKWEMFSFYCNESFRENVYFEEGEQAKEIDQLRDKNPLLKRKADGTFEDVGAQMGVHTGGWTWTAKFADLDNDEWQDLYIVNGDFPVGTRESNYFYVNQGGKKFENRAQQHGLESFLATSAYSYVDYDNDGDLDIISLPIIGPALVYENRMSDHQSIAFELRDELANRFGLGARIIVYYGGDESHHQMREIKAGGGFVSYDAPVAHFGLGEFDTVERVEIQWPTGDRTELRGPFPAGARYRVRRSADAGRGPALAGVESTPAG